MAENPADGLIWLLEVRREHTDWLADIRHWQHLRIATDEKCIWVKGFRDDEINAVPVRSIPVKKIWYQRENLLFLQGSIVPSRKAPTLLWSPIERGLPLQLPPWNHNYFGFSARIRVRLVSSSEERPAAAMLAHLAAIREYIGTASSIRLKALDWTILDAAHALVLGAPLLPVPAQALWVNGDFLIPAGYQFQYPEMTDILETMLNDTGAAAWTMWRTDGTYIRIPKKSFSRLSIGSFRQSFSLLQHTKIKTDENAH
jgi:hypothetical protein